MAWAGLYGNNGTAPPPGMHLIDKTKDVFNRDTHVVPKVSDDGVEAWQNGLIANQPVVLPSTIIAILLIVFATMMNVRVLLKSFQSILGKKKMSSMDIYISHLASADLMVTSIYLPSQAGWISAYFWRFGDVTCRVFAFTRIFGLNLSGMIIACIAVDRTVVVFAPFKITSAKRRAKMMMLAAWVCGALVSAPEAVLHGTQTHLSGAGRVQHCTTFGSFASTWLEFLWAATKTLVQCVLPFLAVLVCYPCIAYKINREPAGLLRRSVQVDIRELAKKRTLMLAGTISMGFITCWIPSYVMGLWYWIDPSTTVLVPEEVQSIILLCACSNALLNPMVYAYYELK